MALTGMQIYKNLPKTNCKDCGVPTCMAFAMQVAAKKKALTDCPHVSDDAKTSLSEASAPPMKLVTIGKAGKQFATGQETVMFRHEEKFRQPTGIAVKIPASSSDEEAAAMIDKINKSSFERVGQTLKVELCAVEVEGAGDPAGRAKLAAEKSVVPIVLCAKDAGIMKSAAEAIKDELPLLCAADKGSVDDFVAIAASLKCPLVVRGENPEEMSELTEKAKAKGVENIVMSFQGGNYGDTLRSLTLSRRAALKQKYRPLGYPAMIEINEDDVGVEMVLAGTFAAKYSGIVMINNSEPWELLPIMTTVQNIYTDPQVPNTVEAKLHEVGSPNENSPVLFTTNFSLTYFSVEGEVERSKIPAYICVVDTEGLGVLNAYAGDKISAEKVLKALTDQKVAEKVKHRRLIIPGLLPIFKGEIEDMSEWKEVILGPNTASKIPAFLNENWK